MSAMMAIGFAASFLTRYESDLVCGDSCPSILGPSVLYPGYGVDLPDQFCSADRIARAAFLRACIEPVEAAATSKLGNVGYAPRPKKMAEVVVREK